MNSITQAYSVIAGLLILGTTLLLLPISVLSQSDLDSTQEASLYDNISKLESSEEVLSQNSLLDPYKRENLPTQEVFSDFVVGPGRVVLELAPGESKTIELVISNRMGGPKRFSIKTEDTAGTYDASSALVLLGDDRGPYSLKDFISVPTFEFNLEHAKRVRVPVTITLPPDADPGGHYGSLLVSIISDSIDAENNTGASSASVIISRIGVLFFISNPGDAIPEVELKEFSTVGDKVFFSKDPISFAITHENTGTVHTTPYGEIRIRNMLGDEVGFIELTPWFVMPESLRTREVQWNREFLIGRYIATAQVNRGYEDIINTKTLVFWVLPWKLFASVFITLLIFFLLLGFLSTKFELKRK